MTHCCIVDYGMGNLASVAGAIRFLGYSATVANDAASLAAADVIILPGVGAFGQAMANLCRFGLIEALDREVHGKGKPFLGVCLGMQLLAEHSTEEGAHQGLGWIPGRVERIGQNDPGLRVPHVGWNGVSPGPADSLFADRGADVAYYFDHSYHLICPPDIVAATCTYGDELVAAVHTGTIFATQFHPEKSQTAGLKLLRRFFRCIGARQSTGQAA
ncbi:imidazole glycerol phosphate synthase subunit HisH [Azospirillum sp. Marseille-Q6669]